MTQTDPTRGKLLVGNCLETLKTLDDASIDSIVTDPPYELGFMGKSWDASGIAYQVELWQECLRVLKPGGHLLAFGGTRTYHRMAVAIEDAGFEIRDSIHWTYGSGFPKSLNIAKSIGAKVKTGKASPKGQRMAAMGSDYKESPLAGTPGYGTTGNFVNKDTDSKPLAITTAAAIKWDGWGTALKPSHEPIVVARKPLTGTVAENIQMHGTGAINIDATRVGDDGGGTNCTNRDGNGACRGHDNAGRSTSGATVHAAESTGGRFPANTLLTHNHDCQQTGTASETIVTTNGKGFAGSFEGGENDNGGSGYTSSVAVWSCTPNCPVDLLDQQSGISKSTGGRIGKKAQASVTNVPAGEYEAGDPGFGDTGGASRFFHNSQWSVADDLTPFIYQAKPGKKERNAGLDGLEAKRHSDRPSDDLPGGDNPRNRTNEAKQNFHPTVKPVELIRYLIRMVTPPKGIVLDPFLGSGTTAVAAVLEGFEWKGCELTEDYLPIIKGRVAWATKEAKAQAKAKAKEQQELPLATEA